MPTFHPSAEPGGEVGTEVVAVGRERDDGLEVVELVGGAMPYTAEDDAVQSAAAVGVGGCEGT